MPLLVDPATNLTPVTVIAAASKAGQEALCWLSLLMLYRGIDSAILASGTDMYYFLLGQQTVKS